MIEKISRLSVNVFFTADHHFGHENIIKYCSRPFERVLEMDDELVKRWNDKVRPNDIVYHLGDFTLGDREVAREFFGKLNGSIYVLWNPWHHDKRWLPTNRDRLIDRLICYSASGGVVRVCPSMVVLEHNGLGKGKYPKAIVLCHYAMAKWDRKHYGSWHLYGHSHGQFENGGLSMDVGVDANDFYPVSLSEVVQIMRKREEDDYE